MGPDDEVGSLNHLGPEQVLAAARLATQGRTFTLQRLIGDPEGDPVWPGGTPAERTQVLDESTWDSADAPQYPGGLHDADDKINAFLQGSTQYDALGHVRRGGQLWNGCDAPVWSPGLVQWFQDTEIPDLEQLADDCAQDRQYASRYVAAPLKVAQGSGSPVDPVVVEQRG